MTHTTRAACAAAATLFVVSLAACSDESSAPDGTSSSTSSSAQVTPQDRSDEVFSGIERPKVLGSATGPVSLGIGHPSIDEHVIFEVTGVEVAEDATVLQYQLTAKNDVEFLGMEGEYWFDQPTLQAPGSEAQLQTVTASVPKGQRQGAQERCVCTSVRFAGPDPRSQTALYPALPKDATEVEVTLPGLDPVTVPVSR